MVLTRKNGSKRSRVSSNAQNIPPRVSGPRSLAHRMRGSLEAARRQSRNSPSSTDPESMPNIPVTRRAKKKVTTAEDKPLIFEVTVLPSPVSDVEMRDAGPRKTRVTMGRDLSRPALEEVNIQRIAEIDENLADVPLDVIRMNLDLFAPEFARSLTSVTVLQRRGINAVLPKEINIRVNDSTTIYPTHILAVTNSDQQTSRRKVNIYPVHSLVLAAQCAKMPPFPPALPLPADQPSSQIIPLPVLVITIPHIESFTALLLYLYCKDPMKLARDVMPLPPPTKLFEDHAQITQYATRMAMTFTEVALVQLAAGIHGLWQNVCAFSIDDYALWNAMDILWEVFLNAMMISTGQRKSTPTPSLSQQEQQADRSTAPSTETP